MQLEIFLTTAQAAKRLDICPDTVRQLARAGKLKYAAIVGRNGQRLFSEAEVDRALKQRRQKATRGQTRENSTEVQQSRIRVVKTDVVQPIVKYVTYGTV